MTVPVTMRGNPPCKTGYMWGRVGMRKGEVLIGKLLHDIVSVFYDILVTDRILTDVLSVG